MELKSLYEPEVDVYSLDGFQARIIDQAYLDELGVSVKPSPETMAGLHEGSIQFIKRIESRTVIPVSALNLADIDVDEPMEIHNYTGKCPALTYEVSPVKGCFVGCLYCLVTDGVHENRMVAYSNYHELVRRRLDENRDECHYFYFSPKTEAFQEPTLQTGIAHRVLCEFINHYERYPESKARLFVASKAGARHLLYEHEGVKIIDLFEQLKDKMQFNTSVSIMPAAFRSILEPYAAPLEERMAAVDLCREHGVPANSALIQPIVLPYLTDERMREFFGVLSGHGIVNYKPEFLTACMENLAMLGQILGYYDKDMERKLYECYIAPDNADHRKQRGRTAPNRADSIAGIRRMAEITDPLGMSVSICYWVRKELGISEDEIPLINRNGFQCLGYQSRLFDGSDRYA